MRSARICVIALAVSVGAVTSVWAQAPVKPGGGIEVGLDISHVSPASTGQTIEFAPGLLAGIFGTVPVTKTIGLQVGADYVQKHTKINNNESNIDYLEIPIMARMPLFKGLYMNEGVGFSFPVKATGKSATAGTETDFKDQVTSPDFSIIISGGIPINKKAAVEIRYDGGFKKVIDLPSAPVQRQRVWGFLLSWKL